MASRITRWVSLKCRHILSLCHPISTHDYTGILILTGIGMSNQPASHVRPFGSANRPKAALLKWLCFILLTRWVFCLNRGSSVNYVCFYFCQNLQRWWNWQKKINFPPRNSWTTPSSAIRIFRELFRTWDSRLIVKCRQPRHVVPRNGTSLRYHFKD